LGRNERGFRAGEIEVSERGKGREERERARVTSEANYERESDSTFVRMKETIQERMREKELTVSPQQALENAIAIKTNTLLSHLPVSLVITHHFPSSSHESLAPNSPPNNTLQLTAQLAITPALQTT